jgi:hypothetical protein
MDPAPVSAAASRPNWTDAVMATAPATTVRLDIKRFMDTSLIVNDGLHDRSGAALIAFCTREMAAWIQFRVASR